MTAEVTFVTRQHYVGMRIRRNAVMTEGASKPWPAELRLRKDRKTTIETGNAEKVPAIPACDAIWRAVEDARAKGKASSKMEEKGDADYRACIAREAPANESSESRATARPGSLILRRVMARPLGTRRLPAHGLLLPGSPDRAHVNHGCGYRTRYLSVTTGWRYGRTLTKRVISTAS